MLGATPGPPLAPSNSALSASPQVQGGAAAASGSGMWSLRLLGTVEAANGAQSISHWPSRAVAALLARLALAPDRNHPREELVELLWPGVALDIGRNRLRQALSTLKRLLEPAGAHAPPVLLADRMNVRMAPGAIACDALEFERLVRSGDSEGARALYRGELMPGFYEEWVVDERRRLAALFERLDAVPILPAPARPATGTAAAEPNSLPSYWTRLYGVDHSAARLRALVCTRRLVTVCGAGGSGKTRLAVEVAQALRDATELTTGWATGWSAAWAPETRHEAPAFERIVFVSLVDCQLAAHAVDAIAGALHIAGPDLLARIEAALAGRRTLLVLDNFEQLARLAGEMLTRLLTGAASLHLLVTSRQRLGLDGEQVFELGGLPLPELPAAAEGATAHPAVALFMDRARAARADFRLGPHDAPAVIELVGLLAGMPLAIELAASRMRSMAPQELLRLLSQHDGTPMLDLLERSGPQTSSTAATHRCAWSWPGAGASSRGRKSTCSSRSRRLPPRPASKLWRPSRARRP